MAELNADDTGKTGHREGKGQAGVKMNANDVPTAKENGFGDIVTLNVGGRR